MSRKLDQMNRVLQEIVDTIEDDTLLAVFGDHGMTAHGDHGGSTEEEIASSLFLYSGGPPIRTIQYNRNEKAKPFPYFNISSATIDDTKNFLVSTVISQMISYRRCLYCWVYLFRMVTWGALFQTFFIPLRNTNLTNYY